MYEDLEVFVEMLTDNIQEMYAETETDLEVATVKELSDFSGNKYYITEFTPTGYLICHGETGEMIEYSESASSPYLEYSENLYYCGPTYYYIPANGGFTHSVLDEDLDVNDVEAAIEYSENINANLFAATSTRIKLPSEENLSEIEDELMENENELKSYHAFSSSTATVSNKHINGYEKIQNLNTAKSLGYYSPDGSGGVLWICCRGNPIILG